MINRIKALIRDKFPFALPLVIAIRHQKSLRKIRQLLQEGRAICIELGAGNKSGQGGWITIDMARNCDIYWDLRRGLPFPNDSVKRIYSSHFFEHLSFREAQRFLNECKRALVPGGHFSICVPNAKLYIDAYAKGHSLDAATFLAHEPACNRTTRIDYVNYIAYMGGEHRYMFDEDNLLFILKSRGFENVRLRNFDRSVDLKAREFESIYAEAEK
jgi:predicted SAM-dependent methyltransferase